MNSKTKTIVGSEDRPRFGVMVSIANEDRSMWRTFHRTGEQLDALKEITVRIDALPGRWYIESISTPDTVYRDVGRYSRQEPMTYERQRLSRIKRLDLLRVPLERQPGQGEEPDRWRKSMQNFIRRAA